MHALANRVVDVESVLPSSLRELPERLAEARSWEARFALVDDALAAGLADARKPSTEIVWAWNALVRTSGRVPVGALAERLGRSRRYLSARFREHVGLPPKAVARILRFRRAVELLQKQPARSLAELAFECGYYDQAHLNRDFREFAGASPGVRTPDRSRRRSGRVETVTFVQDSRLRRVVRSSRSLTRKVEMNAIPFLIYDDAHALQGIRP